MSKKIDKQLDKWQFVFTHGQAIMYNSPMLRHATFGVLKITSLPAEGVRISKSNYKGFLISWYYWTLIARDK